MRLTLTPATEAALWALATRHGQTPETILETLVSRAAEEERERQETLSGLRRSAEEFAAGHWTTPEDLDAALRARRPGASSTAKTTATPPVVRCCRAYRRQR